MKTLKYFSMLLSLAACFVVSAATCSLARPPQLPPTHKDVAYDDAHAAQKLDVYLAKSDKPVPAMIHIHGGGWRVGSKNHVPAWLLKSVGTETELVVVPGANHSVAGAGPQVATRATTFVREQLLRP